MDFDSGDLYAFDPATVHAGEVVRDLVGATGILGMGSLEYNPADGMLYGFTVGTGAKLYKIDPNTADSTEIGALGLGFVFEGSLVFAPNGTAYGTNAQTAQGPQFFTVNLTTGAATTVHSIGGLNHDVNGTAWRSDGKIVGLDREQSKLIVFSPDTGLIGDSWDLGFSPGAVGGMAVLGNQAYFSTSGPGGAFPGSHSLYKVDLFTGVHSLVGTLGAGADTGFSGLAAVPEPMTVLLAVGALAAARRRRRR